MKKTRGPELAMEDYARLASFRHALRAFLHFSEEAAAEVGLTGSQYQALLVLRAWPPGEPVTIADLAGQLFLRHNSTVGLVDRLEAEGLLAREACSSDRRKVELRLTARGLRVLAQLVWRHRSELQRMRPEMERFFRTLAREEGGSGAFSPPSARPPRAC